MCPLLHTVTLASGQCPHILWYNGERDTVCLYVTEMCCVCAAGSDANLFEGDILIPVSCICIC